MNFGACVVSIRMCISLVTYTKLVPDVINSVSNIYFLETMAEKRILCIITSGLKILKNFHYLVF